MDFKIEIQCAVCKCSFELRPQDFKDRASMECPNCGQAFPADAFDDLKTGMSALGRVQEFVGENENPFSDPSGFTVRIKSFGNLHDIFDRESN